MALVGHMNDEKIWNFFKSKGINDYGCAGLIANLDYESALNPKNLQDSFQAKLGFTDDSYTAAVDSGSYTKFINDGAGYGLSQFTFWTRKQGLLLYAKSKGKSVGDLELQLEYIYKELCEDYQSLLRTLMLATSVYQASNAVLLNYERPADTSASMQNKRSLLGQKYYEKFAGNTAKEECIMGYKTCRKGIVEKLSTHFNSTEFDCHGVGCCSQTKVNEQLVEYLQNIRNHFGKPITITSGYRCAVHNKNVGGATGSRHSKGDAADIVVKGVTPAEVAKYAESIGIKGIGLYETASDGYFVHIDTRSTKSFWYGQRQEYRSTFSGASGNVSSVNSSNNSSLDTILNYGDSGEAVKNLQAKLIRLGYSCGKYGADGDFGAGTEAAVRKFQSKTSGLAVDGIAGYQTLNAIDKAIVELDKKESSASYVGHNVQVTANVLNVRSGAGTNNPIVSQVRKGTVCKVISEYNSWCKLATPSGWVSKEYIKKI